MKLRNLERDGLRYSSAVLLLGSCLLSSLMAQQRNPIPVIDGELADPLWQEVPSTRMAPVEAGIPTEQGGEIHAAVMGGYLYFGARMPEPSGRIAARSIGINPNWEDGEDHLWVHISTNLAPSDWVLGVNPLGAYSLEWKGQFVYPEAFLVGAQSDEKEWTVEMAVPLRELRSSPADALRLSAERVRAMRPGCPEQRWRWPEHGPVASVPVFGGQAATERAPLFRSISLANQHTVLEAGRANHLPPLDRRWTDSPWNSIPAWKLLRNEALARTPKFPTEVKVLHAGRTLALMARCAESEGVVARANKRDGRVDQDDSFQVFLATSGSTYVQFAINPLGYLLDAASESGGPYKSRGRVDWDSSVQGMVQQEPGGWTARIDIPLESVAKALGEVKAPREWRILLLRSRPGRSGETREISVLPVTQTDTPVCPARYQRLALIDRDATDLQSPQIKPPSGELVSVATRVLSAEQRKQLDLPGMLDRNIRSRVRKILEAERREWDQVETVDAWERFRNGRLKALAASLGQFPPRVPLQTQVTKEFRGNGYLRQDLIYQSRPGIWVTSNLYLPAVSSGRVPAILVVHSHHRPRTQAELQDMGILWARAGCAVLIMDQLGHGERLQNYPWNREAYHSRYILGMQLYLIGESLIKWMVWDIMRGIDLLLDRKDVDERKIILLGAVAGGGDPAAVTAALDPRVAAVAPFNFGESTPEYPRFLPEKNQWPLELADPGWGEWESTRCLRRSITDQFLPWMICASVAPRRFIYSFEMGWEVEKLPAWSRYQKVFGFYNAKDRLDEAHGFGPFPGPGECTNIGPAQRRSLYPVLNRWFGIPIPSQEPEDRRPESELSALNSEIAASLSMHGVHAMAREQGLAKLEAARSKLTKMTTQERREWIQRKWREKLGDIEPNSNPSVTVHGKNTVANANVEAFTVSVESDILVPALLLTPRSPRTRLPVVIAVSEGGKERFLTLHGDKIENLLKAGAAVCLPDVRGTGETSPDPGRGPDSEEVTLAATELMLGNTLLGSRLKDIRTLIAYLEHRPEIDPQRIGLWGDSHTPINPSRLLLDELPGWQIGPQIQQQAEPLGGLLAMLAALYESNVRALAVRKGLVGYLSILEDRFAYVPFDIIVPGALEVGDLRELAAAISPRPMLLEGLIDGRNRLVPDATLRDWSAAIREAYQRDAKRGLIIRTQEGTPDLAQWLIDHL